MTALQDIPVQTIAGAAGDLAAYAGQPKVSAAAMREKLSSYGVRPSPEPEVLWNFETFLVSRTGEVLARFSPDTPPDDPQLLAALERALSQSGA